MVAEPTYKNIPNFDRLKDDVSFQFDKIEALYKQGKYLQALKLGETLFGPFRSWQGVDLQIWAARIINNLGMRRTAQAIFIQSWRNNQHNALCCYYYARTLTIRKGALAALQFIETTGELKTFDSALKAQWLAYKAHLLAHYRDFENAYILLDQAKSIDPKNSRVILDHAYVLEMQDRYQDSLHQLKPLIGDSSLLRGAVQEAAYLWVLAGKPANAIHLLTQSLRQFESVGIGFQLLDLLMEYQLHKKVPAILHYTNQHLYEPTPATTQHLATIQSNLAYFNKQFIECIRFAEQSETPFYQTIANNLKNAEKLQQPPLKRVLLSVPFVRQHHLTCAPATLTAVCKYWQFDVSQTEIEKNICYNGTTGHAERKWAEENGFFVKEFELQLLAVKTLIDLEFPITLATVEPGSGHLQAIIGYDEFRGVYLIRDSYSAKLQEFLIKETAHRYASTGPRCMALVPDAKASKLKDIVLPCSELYDYYYQLIIELEDHNPKNAAQQLNKMLQLNPKHRLSFSAQRHMSHYENDEAGTLKHTEKLLQLYPNDINLVRSKINSMRSLATPRERMTYLEEVCHSNKPSAHLLIFLADELKFDHRQKKRTEILFKTILRELPTNSRALYSYACLAWDQRKFTEGLFLYRLTTCLEDKEELYAESYFKAATHHHQKAQALKFLKDRFEQFLPQSSAPAFSYCKALEIVGKHHELESIINEVIQVHPSDGKFLAFAANIHLQNGAIELAKQLLDIAENCSHQHDFLPALAALYERLGFPTKSNQAFEKILESDPLNSEAIRNIVRFKMDQDREQEAFSFIDSKLELHPSNKFLLQLKIHWIKNHQLLEKEQALRNCLTHFPNDIDSLCELGEVLASQQKTIEALPYYIKAQSISPGNVFVLEMMGKYYLTILDLISAQNYFKQAIKNSIDHSHCFDQLLNTATDIDEKKRQIEFIFDELIAQSTLGETLLNFYNLARMYLSGDELSPYLKILFQEKSDLYQAWIAFIHFQTNQNELDYALGLARQATDYFPLIPRIWVELAEINRLSGDFDHAEQSLLKSLSISPHWSKAVYQLADLYEIQGEYPKAIGLLRIAIKAQSFNPTLYGSLAHLLWKENETQEAINLIQKAVKHSPSYIWGWEMLQQWSHQLGTPEIALNTAQQLVNECPHDPEHWTLLAYVSEDNLHKMNALEHALELAPQSIAVNSAVIRCLANLNRFEEAHALCHHKKWANKPPTEIKAYQAWLHAKENNTPKAIEKMQQVIQADPSFFDGWQLLSDWSEQLNDKDKAIEYACECVKLKPHCASTLCFCAEKHLINSPHYSSSSAENIDSDNTSDNTSNTDSNNTSNTDSINSPNKPSNELFNTHKKAQLRSFQNKAQALLKKSFQLNPSDQYNALTYIDLLIDQEEFQLAAEVTNHFKVYNKSPYLAVRQLKIACILDQYQDAMDYWYCILNSDENSSWLFDTALQIIHKTGLDEEGLIEIEKVLHQNPINPHIGSIWAQHHLNKNQMKKAIQHLEYLDKHEGATVYAIETLLKHCLIHDLKVPSKLIKRCPSPMKTDTTHRQQGWELVWGFLILNCIEQKQWQKAAQWAEAYWQQPNVDPWMVYYYSLAVRQLGRWHEAAELVQHAEQLISNQPDDDHHAHYGLGIRCLKTSGIKIWRIFDTLLDLHQCPPLDDLLSIDKNLFSPLEHYIFWLAYALTINQDRHFEDNIEEVSQALLKAKAIHHDLDHNPAAKWAKQTVHHIFSQSIDAPAPQSFIHRLQLFKLF